VAASRDDESSAKPERAREIPHAPGFDGTAAFFAEGYAFISDRCSRLRSDIFQTRLFLQPTICMRGCEAAALFYDESLFQRRGAAQHKLRHTLFGARGVQELDGAAHRQHKAMLLSLLQPSAVRDLCARVACLLDDAVVEWQACDEIVVLDQVQRTLCHAVAEWAGMSLPRSQVDSWTHDLVALIEAPARVGTGYWRGRMARGRRERELAALVDDVRTGIWLSWPYSPLPLIAGSAGANGAPLRARVAAVELLNLLRPTVAVAWYVVLAVLALHEHPRAAEIVRDGGERELECFVHEVRRFYPFVPFVAARTRHGFQWNGYGFPARRRVLLDLYGTNRDPRAWEAAHEFRPERFLEQLPNPYAFVPQGGGDPAAGHRCPGEAVSVELTKLFASVFCRDLTYTVPDQDLTLRPQPPPTPRSRLRLRNVRPRGRR
jgi:fatty-acid peroxygenase